MIYLIIKIKIHDYKNQTKIKYNNFLTIKEKII